MRLAWAILRRAPFRHPRTALSDGDTRTEDARQDIHSDHSDLRPIECKLFLRDGKFCWKTVHVNSMTSVRFKPTRFVFRAACSGI